MSQKKFALHSLGCKVNQAEVDTIAQLLSSHNWNKALPHEEADLCIINTCTVTNIADRKSRQKIRRVIKDNPEAFIIVTGCYAESQREDIKKIDGVNLVLNNIEKGSLFQVIKEKFSLESQKEHGHQFFQEGRTRAFLKIQDGCDNFCSYCIIPFVRGKPVSNSMEEVLDKAGKLHMAGYKEIVLTGINLGTYGRDFFPPVNLSFLLKNIFEKIPLERLRISSIEPPDVDENLLNLFSNYKAFCHHLHIPLQYGHNDVLTSMSRNYTVEKYREIINFIKSKVDDISITTDVMVGFPGEKEEHFLHTCRLIEELEFSKLHVFMYSPRKGTEAFNFKDKINDDVKKERSKILLETGESLRIKFYKRFIGKTMSVLFEHRIDKNTGLLKGLTGNYIQVLAEGMEKLCGQVLPVKILDMRDESLFGEIIT